MTAILNPGFETAGALPGLAEHWTLTTFTARERIAGFGPAPLILGWESFDRWHDLLLELDDTQTVRAFFDPHAEGCEDFEEAWQNDLFLREVPTGHLVAALFGSGLIEDMEAAWDNVPYARDWSEVTDVPALFDGEATETCEHGWYGNEQFIWLWSGVTSEPALFDAGTALAETFAGAWNPANTI